MNANTVQHSKEMRIKKLVETLCDDDGLKRKEARQKLVKIGETTLEYVNDLLEHPKHICRWEAMKVIEEIGLPASIPVFMEALEDDESDIRWIAAEGLIRTGEHSLKPLLNLVIEKYDSIFVLNGVHHVFYELNMKKRLPKSFPVDKLLSLLKKTGGHASLKMLVYKILEDLN